MDFSIEWRKQENGQGFGRLFFSLPNGTEMEAAEKKVQEICLGAVDSFGESVDAAMNRLQFEFAMMNKTGTACFFLICKEIADFSEEMGYPVYVPSVAGSVMAYLMGFSPVNPVPAAGQDSIYDLDPIMVWKAEMPYFEMKLARPVVEKLRLRMDEKFGDISSPRVLYGKIGLQSQPYCEYIGKLRKLTADRPSGNVFGREILHNVLQKRIDAYDYFIHNESQPEGDLHPMEKFIESLKEIKDIDFALLVRICGYLNGTFLDPMNLDNLYDKNYFVFQDELLEALRGCGVPPAAACNLVDHGGLENLKGESQKKYFDTLKGYNVPDEILGYIPKMVFLQEKAGTIMSVERDCTLEWYRLHYPEEYGRVVSGETVSGDTGGE
ncbi:MAG: hypothetical protein LUC41_04775 [Clostridiales bacterium]|nr:hypothetical protein [Clostridiales bacterium]